METGRGLFLKELSFVSRRFSSDTDHEFYDRIVVLFGSVAMVFGCCFLIVFTEDEGSPRYLLDLDSDCFVAIFLPFECLLNL